MWAPPPTIVSGELEARCQPIRTRHANKQAGICLAATPKHSVAALSKF